MEDNLKKILRALSLELRHILEGQYDAHGQWMAGDLERRLNEIGVWRERAPKPLDELPHLSAEDKNARKVVDAYIQLREEAGVPLDDAVAEFVRESAYTWANRLFALRCMEARGIVDEVILQKETYGGRSMVHNRFARRNPEASAGEDEGIFTVLFDEFAARSQELPSVFDPDAPATALRPSIAVLKRCIALLSGRESVRGQLPATDEVFEAADASGWAYQYWNTEEKARVFEAVRTKKGTKIEGADIIPATQLYTETYMVKFLVQNSLGALWMGMHPESRLVDEWEYYVRDADRAPAARKAIEDITFLDPAVGSGHFLLEAFDMLFEMYEEDGRFNTPEEIATSILNSNLYGIDIDERATQIAFTALWMRAKERAPNLYTEGVEDGFAEFRHHIVPTNIRLPRGKNHLAAFLTHHPEDRLLEPALRLVFEGLENAHELGSLLQIEEPVERELQRLKEEQETREVKSLSAHPELFDKAKQPHLELHTFGTDDWVMWKTETLARLRNHFDEEAEAADLASSFFGETVSKGLDVFDLLARRYDVVVANPPYMGSKNMGVEVKAYLSRNYSTGKRDLYASFFLRCGELAKESGRVAMITPDTWATRSQMEDLREQLFNSVRLEVLIALDRHAFEEADPPGLQMLTTFQHSEPRSNSQYSALSCLGVGRAKEQADFIRKACSNVLDGFFKEHQSQLAAMPAKVVTVGLGKNISSLLSSTVSAKQLNSGRGISTGNNNRFIRFWWESCNSSDARTFVKALNFSTMRPPESFCTRWRNNGFDMREMAGARLQNMHLANFMGRMMVIVGSKKGILSVFDLDKPIIPHDSCFFVPDNGFPHFDSLGQFISTRLASAFFRAVYRGSFSVTTLAFVPKKALEIPLKDSWQFRKQLTRSFLPTVTSSHLSAQWKLAELVWLLSSLANAVIECLTIDSLELEREENIIFKEISPPLSWFPLITGYDVLPEAISGLPDIPAEVRQSHDQHERHKLSPSELANLKRRLHELYAAGAGARPDFSVEEVKDARENDGANEDTDEIEEEETASFSGTRISVPSETLLEELSVRLEMHPVSVYHLLREGIEQEGWRCLSEERRLTEDRVTVIVLRLLGHRWPHQIEAGEQVPAWADADGIIPITETGTEPTLLRRIQEHIESKFNGKIDNETERTSSRLETLSIGRIEREFADIVGTSLDKWISGAFFRRHISQFKKRPIAWHIESQTTSKLGGKGRKSSSTSNQGAAFSCLVYYHKLDSDLLPKLRTLYVGELRRRYETELRTLEGIEKPTGDQSSRKVQLESQIEELKSFDTQLEEVVLFGFGPEKLRSKLRQYAIDDAMLSLTSRWLKRLSQTVQDGPLNSWQDAARETFLHEDFPQWIQDSVRHLEYTCATVGPKSPDQKTLITDPTSPDLAPIISVHAKSMVEGALAIACQLWWKRFDEMLLSPIRLQIKQLEVEIKQIEQELDSDENTLTVSRRKEITNLRKLLKTEITGLKKEVRERTGRAEGVRRRIESWQCKECETWQGWLASQPLYDEVASLDGKRPAPTTGADFIAQESIYAPDLNDGVRVNIAPLQKAGLLAADVLASNDLDKAIADRAEWRADERRWCREGKLPRPGWWKQVVI